jgi:hypothetical protein
MMVSGSQRDSCVRVSGSQRDSCVRVSGSQRDSCARVSGSQRDSCTRVDEKDAATRRRGRGVVLVCGVVVGSEEEVAIVSRRRTGRAH